MPALLELVVLVLLALLPAVLLPPHPDNASTHIPRPTNVFTTASRRFKFKLFPCFLMKNQSSTKIDYRLVNFNQEV
ncbi:hypothetical protein S2091_0733 [Solimicrobium silvestre]|uniref:Uncharacterized protein n=1 Tax=Solimicrobium silvestre TaxID=2099400 RepID=A0A2S9H432_9BURK|nr:hypothetical protein S2091_0733 [Solimicrobium silvestre]